MSLFTQVLWLTMKLWMITVVAGMIRHRLEQIRLKTKIVFEFNYRYRYDKYIVESII